MLNNEGKLILCTSLLDLGLLIIPAKSPITDHSSMNLLIIYLQLSLVLL